MAEAFLTKYSGGGYIPKIEYGTGGSSVTFSFEPKVVIIGAKGYTSGISKANALAAVLEQGETISGTNYSFSLDGKTAKIHGSQQTSTGSAVAIAFGE